MRGEWRKRSTRTPRCGQAPVRRCAVATLQAFSIENVSNREEPETGDEGVTPSSPYDEPTGAFARPEVSEEDKDAFYERHRRRPGGMSRVESLDDLDPGEVETRQFSTPPAGRKRNPAPTPPPAPIPDAQSAKGNASGSDTRTAAEADKNTGADKGAAPTAANSSPDSAGAADSAETVAIPSVEETFPELARSNRTTTPPATAKLPEQSADAEPTPTQALIGDATPIPADEPEHHRTAAFADESRERASGGLGELVDPDAESEGGRREPETVPAPRVQRGTLDLGLLLLRVAVGAVVVAHGLQKLFGLWGGPGLSGYEDLLTNAANPAIGFNPDFVKPLAIVGAISETVGGGLLVLGLFTPVAGSAVLAVMLMASAYRMTVAGSFSFFAAGGGIEYELVLAVAAAGLILTGPGLYSLDFSRGWARRPFLGSVFWLAVGVAAAVAVWILCNGTNPFASPGNPH